jgi:hypothetical protein
MTSLPHFQKKMGFGHEGRPARRGARIFLTNEYVGNFFFLNDIAERRKLYRVCSIAYWTSNKSRYANWEAALEPVNLLPCGEFQVPDEATVQGPKGIRLTKSKALLGYILAQYIDGDDEEPTRSDCVDLYIENAIEKLKAYLFKLLQSQCLKQSKENNDVSYICFVIPFNKPTTPPHRWHPKRSRSHCH